MVTHLHDDNDYRYNEGVWPRLKAVAGRVSERAALVADGGEALSFAAFVQRVGRCGAGLQAQSCGPGDAVAVLLPNSVDFVVACFATLALGAILVPLNPRFKDEEIQHALEISEARVVLHPPALMAAAGPGVGRFETAGALEAGAPLQEAAVDLAAPALYMFSSGSTGKPKRVTRSQEQLLAEFDALSTSAGIGPSDRILCTIPLYHAHGFSNTMIAGLLSGAGLVLAEGEFNARATLGLLERHRITIYPSVPFMIKMLGESRFLTPPELPQLRLVFTAGAPLPENIAARFAERFGVTVGQLYGSTESGAVTLNVHHQADKPGSVGHPLAGFEVQIRGEKGQPLPARQPGEIWIRTPATTRAYDGLPELSAEVFVGEFFFTGDLGWLDEDGDLYVSGRKKLLINVAGYKVDPLEVEDVLAAHPGVAEAVVIGVPHPGYGEKVKAVVVRSASVAPCDEPALLAFCSERLAEYKVPKLVEFRNEIPRSPIGKILRKYL